MEFSTISELDIVYVNALKRFQLAGEFGTDSSYKEATKYLMEVTKYYLERLNSSDTTPDQTSENFAAN
jgi:hypothetical protein